MNTRCWLRGVVFLGSLAYLAVPALADEGAVQKVNHGEINWTDRTITVTGSAAPSAKAANAAEARLGAERAAKLDAWRTILEAVRGVKVTSTQTVGAEMEAAPEVKSKVEGLLRNFKVVDTKYYSDGGVDVVVRMPLDGVLAEAVVPKAAPVTVNMTGAADFTGLVINAKGMALAPGIAPRVLDEAGNAVYWAATLNPKSLLETGVAAYAKVLDDAVKHPRIGGKPLVIKALRSAGTDSTDVVISNADAAQLRDSTKNLTFLTQGKVMIVID